VTRQRRRWCGRDDRDSARRRRTHTDYPWTTPFAWRRHPEPHERVANGVRVSGPATSTGEPCGSPHTAARNRQSTPHKTLDVKKRRRSVRRFVRRWVRAAKPGCRIGGNGRIVDLEAALVKRNSSIAATAFSGLDVRGKWSSWCRLRQANQRARPTPRRCNVESACRSGACLTAFAAASSGRMVIRTMPRAGFPCAPHRCEHASHAPGACRGRGAKRQQRRKSLMRYGVDDSRRMLSSAAFRRPTGPGSQRARDAEDSRSIEERRAARGHDSGTFCNDGGQGFGPLPDRAPDSAAR